MGIYSHSTILRGELRAFTKEAAMQQQSYEAARIRIKTATRTHKVSVFSHRALICPGDMRLPGLH